MVSATPISALFDDATWTTRSVFIKALTTNDDAGRHGVLVPREAYPLFPPLEGITDKNPSASITTAWLVNGVWQSKKSFFRQYGRYPERRLTSLEPSLVNRDQDRLFAISLGDKKDQYRSLCLVLGEQGYEMLRNAIGSFDFISGANAIINTGAAPPSDSQFGEVLDRLISVSNQGWLPTVVRGDSGVGMTLEKALGVGPNTSTGPDLLNIELKSSRSRKSGKTSLFAKTPKWDSEGRIRLLNKHGYHDTKRDRWALYHSIHGHMESASGWRLRVDEKGGHVFVDRHGEPVVEWDVTTLEESLLKKHRETIFVEAESRGKGEGEEFHYVRATHAAVPSIDRFLSLIPDGRICHDFTMHRTDTGEARDHGFLFRIVKGFEPSLFSYIRTYELG